MKTSKDIIFDSLNEAGVSSEARPLMEFFPTTYKDKLSQFVEILKAVAARPVLLEPGQDINKVIKDLYPDAQTIASNMPEITCATFNPDSVAEPEELNGTDLAVVPAEFGVCENGMVWVNQSVRWKAVYFISESLVFVLDRKNLVDNMHEAYRWPDFNDFGYGCFIAGPSKTADIEQALVIGAHGPCGVTVILK